MIVNFKTFSNYNRVCVFRLSYMNVYLYLSVFHTNHNSLWYAVSGSSETYCSVVDICWEVMFLWSF
jgi:hypothetical protein